MGMNDCFWPNGDRSIETRDGHVVVTECSGGLYRETPFHVPLQNPAAT